MTHHELKKSKHAPTTWSQAINPPSGRSGMGAAGSEIGAVASREGSGERSQVVACFSFIGKRKVPTQVLFCSAPLEDQ